MAFKRLQSCNVFLQNDILMFLKEPLYNNSCREGAKE